MKNKKWLKSPWVVSIGTTIFSFLLTIIRDYSKSKPIFTTVQQILKELQNFIISILNFNIKVWWLLIVIMVIISIIYLVINFKQEEIVKPDFCNYKSDKFKFWRWTWDWGLDHSQKSWVISNLTAHCPNCDTPLISYFNILDGVIFECPRCNFKANGYHCDDRQKVEMVILDNIEKAKKQ